MGANFSPALVGDGEALDVAKIPLPPFSKGDLRGATSTGFGANFSPALAGDGEALDVAKIPLVS